LGDVNWAIEVGIFAEYWATDWFRTRVELRRGFIGQNGYIADLSSDFVAPLGNQWSVSGGPRLRLATAAALQPYFGVDATQSVASGLPIFTPKTGLESVGAGGQVKYQWNSKWASRIYVEYQRLVGDAGDSPIVTQRGSPNQVTAGVGLSYSFDFKLH
jgi:outer membrane protein